MNEYLLPLALITLIAINFSREIISLLLGRPTKERINVISNFALFTSDEVLRLLAQNPTWTASAPETELFESMHARCRVMSRSGTKRVIVYSSSEIAAEWFPIRNDWSIIQSDASQEPLL